jgi:hypothetical protein
MEGNVALLNAGNHEKIAQNLCATADAIRRRADDIVGDITNVTGITITIHMNANDICRYDVQKSINVTANNQEG